MKSENVQIWIFSDCFKLQEADLDCSSWTRLELLLDLIGMRLYQRLRELDLPDGIKRQSVDAENRGPMKTACILLLGQWQALLLHVTRPLNMLQNYKILNTVQSAPVVCRGQSQKMLCIYMKASPCHERCQYCAAGAC